MEVWNNSKSEVFFYLKVEVPDISKSEELASARKLYGDVVTFGDVPINKFLLSEQQLSSCLKPIYLKLICVQADINRYKLRLIIYFLKI